MAWIDRIATYSHPEKPPSARSSHTLESEGVDASVSEEKDGECSPRLARLLQPNLTRTQRHVMNVKVLRSYQERH